jgi:hypothetical protein
VSDEKYGIEKGGLAMASGQLSIIDNLPLGCEDSMSTFSAHDSPLNRVAGHVCLFTSLTS